MRSDSELESGINAYALESSIDERPRILAVDDEELVTEVLSKGLNKNYEVFAFNNPLELIEAYKNNHSLYSAIISDVGMPEMDGVELYRQLASINPDVKVLFLSGADAFRLEELRNEGVKVNFLPKPAKLRAIKESLEKLLKE